MGLRLGLHLIALLKAPLLLERSGREFGRGEVDGACLLGLRPALLDGLEVRHEAPLVAAKLLWVEVARLLGDVYDRGKVLEPKHYMEILIGMYKYIDISQFYTI